MLLHNLDILIFFIPSLLRSDHKSHGKPRINEFKCLSLIWQARFVLHYIGMYVQYAHGLLFNVFKH
jgi:hypothetical protein